jgi:hypothetical protein
MLLIPPSTLAVPELLRMLVQAARAPALTKGKLLKCQRFGLSQHRLLWNKLHWPLRRKQHPRLQLQRRY